MSTDTQAPSARLPEAIARLQKLQTMAAQLPDRIAEAQHEVVTILEELGIQAKVGARRGPGRPPARPRPAGASMKSAGAGDAIRACLPASIPAICEQTGLDRQVVGGQIAGMMRWGKVEKVESADPGAPALYRLIDDPRDEAA